MAINLPESIDSNHSSPLSRPFTESPLPIYHPSLHSWKGDWLWDKRVTVTNRPPPSHAAPHVWKELYTAPTELFHSPPLNAFLKLPFRPQSCRSIPESPTGVMALEPLQGTTLPRAMLTLCVSPSPISACAKLQCPVSLTQRAGIQTLWVMSCRAFPSTALQYRQVIRSKSWLRRSRTGRLTTKERRTVPHRLV